MTRKTPPRLKSCGKAMAGIEIRVVDMQGNAVATGEVGEIVTRSPQNMLGYWNQPEATRRAIRGEWFHTGDAGYLDADGYIYIYDRVKDMIISGGENIYPGRGRKRAVRPSGRGRCRRDRHSGREMGRGGQGHGGQKARSDRQQPTN